MLKTRAPEKWSRQRCFWGFVLLGPSSCLGASPKLQGCIRSCPSANEVFQPLPQWTLAEMRLASDKLNPSGTTTGTTAGFCWVPCFKTAPLVCALNCEVVSGLPRMTKLEKCCLDWLKQLKPPAGSGKVPLRQSADSNRRPSMVGPWWCMMRVGDTQRQRDLPRKKGCQQGKQWVLWCQLWELIVLGRPFQSIYVYHDMLKRGGYIPSGKPT